MTWSNKKLALLRNEGRNLLFCLILRKGSAPTFAVSSQLERACCLSRVLTGSRALSWVLFTRLDSSSREEQWMGSPAELVPRGVGPSRPVGNLKSRGTAYLPSASSTFHAWIPKMTGVLAKSPFPSAHRLSVLHGAGAGGRPCISHVKYSIQRYRTNWEALVLRLSQKPGIETFQSRQFISGAPSLVLANESWSAAPSGLPEFLSQGGRGGCWGCDPLFPRSPVDS